MEKRYSNSYTVLLHLLIVLFILCLLPKAVKSQSSNLYPEKITKTAVENYRIGLNSGNYGIMHSCIYFAGKYRMQEVCSDLLGVIENSNDNELCKLALWSLYQIGNDNYCDMLHKIIENHNSPEVVELFNFLNKIRKYGNDIAINK